MTTTPTKTMTTALLIITTDLYHSTSRHLCSYSDDGSQAGSFVVCARALQNDQGSDYSDSFFIIFSNAHGNRKQADCHPRLHFLR